MEYLGIYRDGSENAISNIMLSERIGILPVYLRVHTGSWIDDAPGGGVWYTGSTV